MGMSRWCPSRPPRVGPRCRVTSRSSEYRGPIDKLSVAEVQVKQGKREKKNQTNKLQVQRQGQQSYPGTRIRQQLPPIQRHTQPPASLLQFNPDHHPKVYIPPPRSQPRKPPFLSFHLPHPIQHVISKARSRGACVSIGSVPFRSTASFAVKFPPRLRHSRAQNADHHLLENIDNLDTTRHSPEPHKASHSPEPTLPSLSLPITTVGTATPSTPSFELDLLSLFSLTAPFPFPFPFAATTADPALDDLAGEPDLLIPISSFSILTPTLPCPTTTGLAIGVDVRLLPFATTFTVGGTADPARLPPPG